jgi:putative endopeptidase
MSGLALTAFAETPDRCIDEYCRMQSLHSLDGFFAGAENGGSEVSTVAKRFGTWGVDLSGMDTSVKPGDDFFSYVNGTAVKNMVIPADKTSIGSFVVLRDLSEARSKAIVTGLAARADVSGDDAKIAAVYNAYMDEAAVEKLGIAPLKPRLAAIKAIKSKAEMARYMGTTSGTFGSAFFNPYVASDEKNPKVQVLLIAQGGLGLPDRDYYLKDSFADKKAKYETYIADMLRLVGYANPEQSAKDILALESKIAEVHWTRIERRDSTKTYNPMTKGELAAYAPGFDWNGFLDGAHARHASKIIVNENTAFPKIAKIFADTPLETLKGWETFRTADQAAPLIGHGNSAHVTSAVPKPSVRAGNVPSAPSKAVSVKHLVAPMSPPTSRPTPRRKWKPWSPTCALH